MIEIAKLNRLRPWQQEKHYIQSLILNSLSELPLVFKGGTYLWFFHGLKRFSEDLDFTASEELHDRIPEMVSRALALFGIMNEFKKIKDDKISLSFRISAIGPLNTGLRDRCNVYVEISRREQIVNKTIPLKFDKPEYQLPIRNILGMNLEEVGAEKVRAIMTREKARDIYDLYHLINNKKIKFDNKLINNKLEYYKTKFSNSKFIDKIIGRKKDYINELKSITFDDLPNYDLILATIKKWISQYKNE
ncbi:MAG: nucleotidyl transferase AbiEii/AbiGii toxin family protein [Candidatus Marsarchaeota archaeon]|nr:nucleotidyl transferase AbiEii/AbiGii toxin family protein [Candidatus Marsarchaeota archaeon]MCL5094434.1 nucleotidyl transferase AbiEii/AbiGii toxin family protein [Candidatus Marsarchaeota archaeon]